MRPQIADIVEVVAEALHLSQEDLGNDKFLVPCYFEIDVHPEALTALKPVEKQLRQEVQKRLDKEMALLNKPPFWQRLIGKKSTQNPRFQKAGVTWDIALIPTLDNEKPINHIGVEAKLENPNVASSSGLLDSLHKTQAMTMNIGNIVAPTAKIAGFSTLQFQYTDMNGQVFQQQLDKPQISIGRFDTENAHVDIRMAASAEVSRQHCLIKQDNGQFFIQDTSANGTSLNGTLLTPNQWTNFHLPASISLAQVIQIEVK